MRAVYGISSERRFVSERANKNNFNNFVFLENRFNRFSRALQKKGHYLKPFVIMYERF